LANALTSDAFHVCISLVNDASSRKIQAANTTMNVLYFGNQNISTIGTLSNKLTKVQTPVGLSAGAIAGAVIGSILGSILIIAVVSFIIVAVCMWKKRSLNVKKMDSFELLNSPASIQSDQEADVANDIELPVERPAEQPVEQQNTENGSFVEDKQDIVTETTNIPDVPVVAHIEQVKTETAIEDVLMDLSDNIINPAEVVLQSSPSVVNDEV
jgi:hypothetical protein